MKRILIVLFLLLAFCKASFAYITLSPSSYIVNVGEEKYLAVPDVSQGYIDNAVWACSNANVTFVEKSAAGAIIKVNKYFSGTAIIELVCVEKYVDQKGYTRANTYYKEFRITCSSSSSGGTKLTSISFPTLNLKVGDIVVLEPIVQPAGAEVTYYSSTISDGSADVARIFINGQNQVNVIARSPGTEQGTITTVEGLSAVVKVNVTAPSTSQIVGPDGATLQDPLLFDNVKKMESLFNKALEFKSK